jgi:hypothetical protein
MSLFCMLLNGARGEGVAVEMLEEKVTAQVGFCFAGLGLTCLGWPYL